ncbi:MAG: glutamyl-tRNA reductase [Rickettsiales bacterium]|nr:glutamyl-tRNA reductase [Rickettsiales bacterium]
MRIGLVGIDHTKSKIQAFESIFLTNEGKDLFYTKITAQSPVKELVILTTCNRVEFYFVAENLIQAGNWIIKTLAIQKNIALNKVESLLNIQNTEFTLKHLFEVSSGVQSMVFGENEILGQVKEAYEKAFSKHKTEALLNKCFQAAVATGKRARSETEISRGAYSVSSIAIDALRKTVLDYFGKSILIIGMGTMGIRCLKKLDALSHPNIIITNRSHEKSLQLASQHDVVIEHYDDIFENLYNFDIIISAVSVKDKVIIPTHFKNNDDKKLIIDLGLPRNVDPNITEEHPNITLINVDGLKEIATKNVNKRKVEIEKVNSIIIEEIAVFNKWFENRQNYVKNN